MEELVPEELILRVLFCWVPRGVMLGVKGLWAWVPQLPRASPSQDLGSGEAIVLEVWRGQ